MWNSGVVEVLWGILFVLFAIIILCKIVMSNSGKENKPKQLDRQHFDNMDYEQRTDPGFRHLGCNAFFGTSNDDNQNNDKV